MNDYNFILLLIGAIVEIILLITWFIAFKHILKISAVINGKDTVKGCIEEVELALFSNNKPEALRLFYRALYINWKTRLSDATYYNKIEELKEELKDKYHDKIIECEGAWPTKFEH